MTGLCDEFFTPDEVAKMFKITKRSVLNLIRMGRLKAIEVGRGEIRKTYRVYEKEVQRYMAENYQKMIDGLTQQ